MSSVSSNGPPSTADHPPPHSPESERGLLSCMLQDSHCVGAIALRLGRGRGKFFDLRHEEIYLEILDLNDRGIHADLVVLQQALKDRGLLGQIDIGYLLELQDVAFSSANALYHADVVNEKA